MTEPIPPWHPPLAATSRALLELLRAILGWETQFRAASPLQVLSDITAGGELAWVRPLTALIADVDHALERPQSLSERHAGAIGADVRRLLGADPAVDEGSAEFLEKYRPLLQATPAIAIAHGAALRAARALPSESDDETERLHARHAWNELRRHHRSVPRQR